MSRRPAQVLVVATIVLWWGISINFLSADYSVFPDTSSYQVQLGFPVSFSGDAWRAWPTPLLFAISAEYRIQVLLQTAVYGLGWTIILWAFFLRVRFVVAVVATTFVTALALTPLYLQWTLTILSEAIVLGFLLIGIGLAEVARRRVVVGSGTKLSTWALVGLSIAFIGMSTMSRLTLLPFLVGIGALLVVSMARARQLLAAIVLIFGIVGTSGYAFWLNERIDEHWGVSRTATYYGYLSARGTPLQETLADPLHAYVTARGPECLGSLRASSGGVDGPDPWEFRRELNVNCPEGVAWLEAHFRSEYAAFLVGNPRYTTRLVLEYLPTSGDATGYAQVVSVLPAPAAALFSSPNADGHEYRPIYMWMLGGISALALGVISLIRRSGNRSGAESGLVIIGGALTSLLLTVVTLNSEVARITSQATALLIFGVVASFALRFGSPTGRFKQDCPQVMEE